MRWVGTTRQILKRICILNGDTKLSVRDERLVRKLAYQQVKECNKVVTKINSFGLTSEIAEIVDSQVRSKYNINLKDIIYHFPCKNVEDIKSI